MRKRVKETQIGYIKNGVLNKGTKLSAIVDRIHQREELLVFFNRDTESKENI